jgi:hypothetical protein
VDPDEPVKDGIYLENGKYYYYVDGVKQTGIGVVELTDDEGKTFYINVCTYGNLATGKYWPTYRNDLLDRGEYDWGTDGRYYPPVVDPDEPVKNGIYLTGGGALIKGLDRRLSAKTGIPVHIAEDPLRAIVRGTGIALKNINRFSFLMK